MSTDPFSLIGKRVTVTGASRGIGHGAALALARAGARVALLARTVEPLQTLSGAIGTAGGESLVLPCDVSDRAAVDQAFARIADEWGGLDGLLNNAGTNIRKSALETTEEDWHRVLSTNLNSTFYCATAAARLMSDGGSVVLMGSVAGQVALSTGVAYAASKAAISQMARTLALEWAPQNIRVNCLAPWYIRTALTEGLLSDPQYVEDLMRVTMLKRIGEVDDLTGAIQFFLSDASSWITGQTLAVDGGMTAYGFQKR